MTDKEVIELLDEFKHLILIQRFYGSVEEMVETGYRDLLARHPEIKAMP